MRRRTGPSRGVAALLALALALGGCGAGDDEPAPTNALPPATCPPLAQLAPALLGHVREGRLAGLRHVVESMDPDEVAVLLDGALRLVKGLRPEQLRALLALGEHPRLLELQPLLVDLLRAIGGDPADRASFRADVVAELSRVVRGCDFDGAFAALDRLLGSPELPTLLARLAEVLRTPAVQDLLRGGAPGALGPDGFVRLVLLVLERMAAPDFDFGALRRVLADLPALRSEEPPLVDLLSSLERLLATEGLFAPLQDLTCCYLYGRLTCEAAGDGATLVSERPPTLRLLYDLFVSEAAGLDGLLDALAALATDPEIVATLQPLRDVLRALAADADVRGKLVRLLEVLLEEENARRVLPEVALLLESGATTELLALTSALLDGCAPTELGR